MGFWSGTGKIAGSIYDLRLDKWLGLTYLRNSLIRSKRWGQSIFRLGEQPSEPETFEEALQKRNLTEHDVKIQLSRFALFMGVYAFFALALLSYTVSQALHQAWFGCLMGLLLTLFCSGHIFRYHYWRFLLLQRNFGLTVHEWLQHTLGQHREE